MRRLLPDPGPTDVAEQYSHLVATVIGSAVIPTIIANALFMPVYLRPGKAAGEPRELDSSSFGPR